jgi:hypothetical protein
MELLPPDITPESWLVSAGRSPAPGAPLNVPLIPASNFIIGAGREYSRDDGTPTWEALEEIVGGLESAKPWRSPPAWPPSPPCSISLRRVASWSCQMISIKVLQGSRQRALNVGVGQCNVYQWTIQPVGSARAASLT